MGFSPSDHGNGSASGSEVKANPSTTILAHIPLNCEENVHRLRRCRSREHHQEKGNPGAKTLQRNPYVPVMKSHPRNIKGTARSRPSLTPWTPASLQETHNANSESSQGTTNAGAGPGTADPAEATGEGEESRGEGESDEEDEYGDRKTVIEGWYMEEWGGMLDTLPDYTSEELEEMVRHLLRKPGLEEYIHEIWKHHCTPSQWQQLQTREREIRQTLQADVTHSREQARRLSGDLSEKKLGDLDKSTEDLPSEKNVPSKNRDPVGFAPDPGVPVDGVGYLRGTTSGRATVPDLSSPRDRAIALGTPDSVISLRAADGYCGSGPITMFSQKMAPIEYFSGKGDRTFQEWFSMLRRSIPRFEELDEARRFHHVAARLRDPAQKYWLTLEEYTAIPFDHAIAEMTRIYGGSSG